MLISSKIHQKNGSLQIRKKINLKRQNQPHFFFETTNQKGKKNEIIIRLTLICLKRALQGKNNDLQGCNARFEKIIQITSKKSQIKKIKTKKLQIIHFKINKNPILEKKNLKLSHFQNDITHPKIS